MSWFGRENLLRTSFNRRKSYRFTPFVKLNEGTCLEVFKSHWQQAWSIMIKYQNGQQPSTSLVDDISSVVNLLDQMTTLLLQEAQSNNESTRTTIAPILDYFLTEGCLEKLFNWSTYTGEHINVLKIEQLKLYEVMVSNCHQDLLFHDPIVKPLLSVLSSCRECCPVEVEKRLVILLNTLCVSITQFPDLLQVFFRASSDEGTKRFLIFSLLIPFVHREGAIGQQARDALLLIMALSRKNESIGMYIAEHSNFCPVLATGLSGLYSVLPRKLAIVSEDWYCFTAEDIAHTPELSMFLNSLEFCNAVIQVAHPMVQEQLLEYLYQGFLIPVLGPALLQTTLKEIIATIAYLEMFLRTITEPILLQVFLKFLLTSAHDEHSILNTLVSHLGAHGQLCLVTMSLFQRLLDMNCEDVVFQLVLRFLIPCSHIMVSQRSRIRDIDIYSSSADKFLALIPSCCTHSDHPDLPLSSVPHHFSHNEPHSLPFADRFPTTKGGSFRFKSHQRSPSTSSLAFGEIERRILPIVELQPEMARSSYMDYLRSAHESVRKCTLACQSWSALYDGNSPPPNSQTSQNQERNVFNGFSYASSSNKTDEKSRTRASSGQSVSTEDSAETVSKPNIPLAQEQSSGQQECGQQILDQLIETDDENTFWNLISSTKTPSSVSDLEDSLDNINISSKETKAVTRNETKPVTDSTCLKEECSNLDSGVFELRDSNSSSDKDNDSEVAVQSSAKRKQVGDSLLLKKVSCSKLNNSYTSTWDTFNQSPNVGPFLSILLTRLEMMMQNDVYTNLHLTGLISRLACYPQPLLRSFLLDHSLVFQPTVRSLLQVLGSLKHKVDSYAYTVDNFDELVIRSRQFLLSREEHFLHASSSNKNTRTVRSATSSDLASSLHRGDSRRSSLGNLFRKSSFFRAKSQNFSKEPRLESISDNQGYRFYTKPSEDALEGEMESVKTQNAVLCAIVLEEFLKEIAAISQEHSIIQLDPDFWDTKWQLTL